MSVRPITGEYEVAFNVCIQARGRFEQVCKYTGGYRYAKTQMDAGIQRRRITGQYITNE